MVAVGDEAAVAEGGGCAARDEPPAMGVRVDSDQLSVGGVRRRTSMAEPSLLGTIVGGPASAATAPTPPSKSNPLERCLSS
jgi:hypothetical protein